MYFLKVVEAVDKIFEKLAKKDKKQLEEVNKKVQHILNNPQQFKPLKFPMQNMRRVHIGSFVLIYDVDETKKIVTLRRYQHHDEVYK